MGCSKVYMVLALASLIQGSYQAYYSSGLAANPSYYSSGGPHVSSYTVAIIRNNDWHQRCVGTLISEDYVLTSAQCVDCETALLIIGAYDILRWEKTQIRQNIGKKNIILHPWYDPRTLDNDIALIKLPHAVKLNPFVNIAKLPKHNQEIEYGTKAYVTGWEHRLTGYSNILAHALVTTISNDKCRSFWPAARINHNKLCASNAARGNHHGGHCIVDAGSSLTLPGHPDKIIGILTANATCGSLLPEVFIRVSQYTDWIDHVLGLDVILVEVDVEIPPAVVAEELPVVDVVQTPVVVEEVEVVEPIATKVETLDLPSNSYYNTKY